MATKVNKQSTPTSASTSSPVAKKIVMRKKADNPVTSAPAPVPAPTPVPTQPVQDQAAATQPVAQVAQVTKVPKKNVKSAKPAASADQVQSTDTSANVSTDANTDTSRSPEERSSVAGQFASVLETLNNLAKQVKDLTVQVRNLRRDSVKDLKHLEQAVKTRKSKGKRSLNSDAVSGGSEKGKRTPSGFAKPTGLSQELCTFLGIDGKSELARTDVTKKITTYVKEHNLQNPDNRKHIVPDQALGKLLNVPANQELTYFNLQKYMKVHFKKLPVVAPVEAAAVPAQSS